MPKTSKSDYSELYAKQFCAVHNISILYFKSNKIMNETQCWDCLREANQRNKSK